MRDVLQQGHDSKICNLRTKKAKDVVLLEACSEVHMNVTSFASGSRRMLFVCCD